MRHWHQYDLGRSRKKVGGVTRCRIFELTAFLVAAVGVLGLVSLCRLVFGRLGVGTIIAFLVAGVVIAELRDIPAVTVETLREFAELGLLCDG